MQNKEMKARLSDEVMSFIKNRKSLQLSTLQANGVPYASYAPFAIGDECLYVLLSEIAVHASNLQHNPTASVLLIEDEDSCEELFARKRVNYTVNARLLECDSQGWPLGIGELVKRHGERVNNLSQLEDFKLFKLMPVGGRYVKGFGQAYSLVGDTLAGDVIEALRDGHKRREVA